MKITLLCSDPAHPVNGHLQRWTENNRNQHEISIARKASELTGGDMLFLISCSEIVDAGVRENYGWTLVLHASDLPEGRGWSPHIWRIIGGADHITLSLIEAEDSIDTGKIWQKLTFPVPKHALWHEVNEMLFQREIELIDFAVNNSTNISPWEQDKSIEPTYFRRRKPEDSELDPNESLANQFDLIRICDPNRFPAFFRLNGHKYLINIEKQDE